MRKSRILAAVSGSELVYVRRPASNPAISYFGKLVVTSVAEFSWEQWSV
jgi:hypothetical protein